MGTALICEKCRNPLTVIRGKICYHTVGAMHIYCPDCAQHVDMDTICDCAILAIAEIYQLVFPWVGRVCSRCWQPLSDKDNAASQPGGKQGEIWFHHTCAGRGEQELEAANAIIEQLQLHSLGTPS